MSNDRIDEKVKTFEILLRNGIAVDKAKLITQEIINCLFGTDSKEDAKLADEIAKINKNLDDEFNKRKPQNPFR